MGPSRILSGLVGLVVLAVSVTPDTGRAEEVPLTSLDLSKMQQDWGQPQVNRSITEGPLSIAGRKFDAGVGSHARAVLWVRLNGAVRFQAWVGVDDATKRRGSVAFKVVADGRPLFDSGVMRGGDSAKRVDVDVSGHKELVLVATPAGDDIHFDHADWSEAVFLVEGTPPVTVYGPIETKLVLTPKPGPEPRINGPRVHGVRPGRPVIYRIPATGTRPMHFAADNLPEGLRLDAETGILTGAAPEAKGEYEVTLRATNDSGSDQRPWKLVVGETIALTPPMGWNHWYTHYHRITAEQVRAAADAMVDSGMADFGYAFVNLDDCWMVKPDSDDPMLGGPPRDEDGAILPNGHFPDMKGLVDYIHAKGLKAGIYTSPGPLTCQRYEGSYQHEAVDARKFAAWGIDFLKYDWCSYGRVAGGKSLADVQAPYRKMGDILVSLDRDIVFNLCQYGMGDVWDWGADVHGNCWRTAGDLGFHLERFFAVALENAELHEHAGPGAWNDPDYLLLGLIGHPKRKDEPPEPTPLTPGEQYAYMSLWCLSAAPLVYSGDITRMDPFTLNVLCNAEVLEVNQDPLGRQAPVVARGDETFVMAKPMEDGSTAVGLFNQAEYPQEVTIPWPKLNLKGPQIARDLWRQKDLGEFTDKFTAQVPPRGVVLIRLRAAGR